MMHKRLYVLLFCFLNIMCLTTTRVEAQDIPETVRHNGEKFLVHKVEAGQTLFGISKKYFCSVDDLLEANPELKERDLKIGQTVLIPRDAMNRKKFRRIDITLDGGGYLTHEVHRKETLYSLSKKYSIDIEEIKKYNPQIEERGLQPGMRLKIPYAQGDDAEPEVMQPPKVDSFELHIVKKKETLFSISKRYNVSVDSIQWANGGLSRGLKEGTTIRIPVKNVSVMPLPTASDTSVADTLLADTAKTGTKRDTLKVDSLIQQLDRYRTFQIGVLMPFSSLLHDSAQRVYKEQGKFILPSPSVTALNLYRGLIAAADSLTKKGFNADIHLYDTETNLDSLKRSFEDSLPEFDLVFGPLFRSNFEWFADLAKESAIPVISPVSLPSKILIERNNAVKIKPGAGSKLMQLAYYVVSEHIDSNLVIWNSGRFKDRDTYATALKHANICAAQLGSDSLKEMSLYTPSKKNVRALFEDSTHYTLFVPSNDQAYMSEFVTSLNDLVLKGKEISVTVYGMESWRRFDNLDTEYFQRLNTRLVTDSWVNYSDTTTIRFIQAYRSKYKADPHQDVLTAYDAGVYFFGGLMKYGEFMHYKLPTYIRTGLSSRFNFIRIDSYTGFENQGFYIYEIDDYEKVLVR